MIASMVLAVAAASLQCLTPEMMERGFFAVSNPTGRDVTAWYERVFNAKRIRRNEGGSGRADVLMSGPLMIEVIYPAEPIEREKIRPGARRIQWTGVTKSGATVRANLRRVADCLEAGGENVASFYPDTEVGIDFMTIVDPNGTVIDIVAEHRE